MKITKEIRFEMLMDSLSRVNNLKMNPFRKTWFKFYLIS